MRILACMVVEIALTKYFIPQSMKGKKIGQIQGRISRNTDSKSHNTTMHHEPGYQI